MAGDRIKAYKLVITINIIMLLLDVSMVYMINSFGLTNLSGEYVSLFDIALGTALGIHSAGFLLSLTMIMKLVSEHTRGSMFAVNAVVGSFGVLMIQFEGGNLYDKVRKDGPFLIAMSLYALSNFLGAFLCITGKLKV